MLAYVNTPTRSQPAELREVDEPRRARDEVLVDVDAFSLNRGELALLAHRPEGWRPGQDIAGVIVESADADGAPRVGDRVVGLVEDAGWAEQVMVPMDRLAIVPEAVSFAQAASLPIAGLTALRTLRLGGALLGKRVLITGARGGVGNLAVQLAERAGAEVTGVSAVSDEVEGLYDLILESVGGASLTAAVNHVAPHGTVVVFGNSSNEPTPVSLYDFFGHEGARLQTFFSYLAGMRESIGEDLAALVSLVVRGLLKPRIGFEQDWRQLPQAIAGLRERRFHGKAILRVGGDGG